MDVKKAKKLLAISLIVVILIIVVLEIAINNKKDEAPSTIISTITVEDANNKVIKINDYNNLSEEEEEYLYKKYGDTAAFTKDGVKIYYESAYNGAVERIITSKWPDNDVSKMLIEPQFGVLDRIEYSSSWMNIYINEAEKSDAKNYVKDLKKAGFKEKNDDDSGKIFTEYSLEKDEKVKVRVRFYKDKNNVQIRAEI